MNRSSLIREWLLEVTLEGPMTTFKWQCQIPRVFFTSKCTHGFSPFPQVWSVWVYMCLCSAMTFLTSASSFIIFWTFFSSTISLALDSLFYGLSNVMLFQSAYSFLDFSLFPHGLFACVTTLYNHLYTFYLLLNFSFDFSLFSQGLLACVCWHWGQTAVVQVLRSITYHNTI